MALCPQWVESRRSMQWGGPLKLKSLVNFPFVGRIAGLLNSTQEAVSAFDDPLHLSDDRADRNARLIVWEQIGEQAQVVVFVQAKATPEGTIVKPHQRKAERLRGAHVFEDKALDL